MKTNFKRLFALVLTLCLLASLMVPVVLAEDEAVAAPSADAAETYPIRLVDMTQTDPSAATGWNTSFAGSGGYKTTVNVADVGKITTSYNAKTLNWRFFATDSSAFQFRLNSMLQPRLDDENSFAALQLRVSKPGAYSLKITMDKNDPAEGAPWTNYQKSWKGNVTAYIIPLSVVNDAVANAVIPEVSEGETAPTAEQVAIRSLMTDKYSVGTVSVSSSQTELNFAEVRIDSDEVVVAYTATNGDFVLCEMSLSGAAYEKKTVANYDITPFDLTADFSTWASHTYNKVLLKDGALITGSAISVSKVGSSDNYATLGWKSYSGSNIAGYRDYTGYQPYIKNADNWGAYQIKVPANGDMYLSFTLDRTESYVIGETTVKNNYTKLACDVTAYLIPLSEVSNIATQIADDTYSVGTKTLLASESTVTFNKAFLTAGEYVVVYKATAGYFYFGEMKLEQLACDEILSNDVANSQTILTGLYDIDDPVFDQIVNKKTTFADDLGGTTLRAYTDALYAEGKLDWKIETYAAKFTDANFLFNSTNRGGLWISTPDTEEKTADWAALRIRVNVGDFYNISLNTGRTPNADYTVYMIPATSDAMSADEIAALMTPANALYFNPTKVLAENQKISVGYLDGEYILVFDVPYDKTREVFVYDIVLESEKLTAEDAQYYNFNLFDESNPYYSLVTDRYTEVTEEVTNEETDETTTVTSYQKIEGNVKDSSFGQLSGVVLSRDAEGNPTELGDLYEAVYADDGSGYPKSLNWRPDAIYASDNHINLASDMKAHKFYDPAQNSSGTVYKSEFTGDESDFLQFTSFMIRVPKAGTYTLSLDGGAYNYSAKVYFIDAHTSYGSYVGDTFVKNNITDEAQANLVGEGLVAVKKNTRCEVGQVTVDAGGDFLVAITTTDSNNYDPYLKGIALTPVIETAVAGVGGATYDTFAEAVAAASDGDTIHLLDVAIADEVVVPAGVTLNLNGQMLVADSVSAIAAGAKVIDSTDGIGVLKVDEAEFDVNNAQLPLYDSNAAGYRLYNVEVESCATTGSASYTKYWFKVNFSNADALDLIGLNTELRIMASMTGVYKDNYSDETLAGTAFAADAYANAAFSNTWANKSTSYIVVSAVGSGLNDFSLSPAVSANGVIISGDAMHKGA